jgi:hypothetical protein
MDSKAAFDMLIGRTKRKKEAIIKRNYKRRTRDLIQILKDYEAKINKKEEGRRKKKTGGRGGKKKKKKPVGT